MLALYDAQVRGETGFSVFTQSGLAVTHPCYQGQLSDTDKMRGKDQLSHINEAMLTYTFV